MLKEHGVAGDRLVLEITEQLAVRFAASTDKQLAMLRELGCQLAIDDFGSGYSSFSYLKRLPVDFLKIDGAFIKSLARDSVDQAMVRMVGEVARAAGIETVAEYVHSAGDVRSAREVRHRLRAGLLHRQADARLPSRRTSRPSSSAPAAPDAAHARYGSANTNSRFSSPAGTISGVRLVTHAPEIARRPLRRSINPNRTVLRCRLLIRRA